MQKFLEPLTKNRLCGWHAALFPTGRSGMHRITVADWRKIEDDLMQIISGALSVRRKSTLKPQRPTAK